MQWFLLFFPLFGTSGPSGPSSSLSPEQDANILHFLSKSSVDLASICKHVSSIEGIDDFGNEVNWQLQLLHDKKHAMIIQNWLQHI